MNKPTRLDVFQALSDPLRRQILDALASHRTLRVKHLVELTGRSQPLISNHVDILIKAGLVTSEAYGRIRWFSLDSSPFSDVKRAIARWEKSSKRARDT